VPEVVADDRALLDAECIYPSHVTEYRSITIGPSSDMVDMVEFHDVAPSKRWSVTPRPTYGYASIIEVGNLIVADSVIIALADPDTNRAVKDLACVGDDAIGDLIAVGVLGLTLAGLFLAYLYAACPDVRKPAVVYRIIFAGLG